MGHSHNGSVAGRVAGGIKDGEPVRSVTGVASSALMVSDVPQAETEAFKKPLASVRAIGTVGFRSTFIFGNGKKRPVADAREAGSLAFMIELAGYTFPPNRASIVCTHVWNGDPVLLFVHDNDGDIQFYCGEEGHSGADAMVLGLAEVSNHLLTMQDIPTVKPGFCAERARLDGAWTLNRIED